MDKKQTETAEGGCKERVAFDLMKYIVVIDKLKAGETAQKQLLRPYSSCLEAVNGRHTDS